MMKENELIALRNQLQSILNQKSNQMRFSSRTIDNTVRGGLTINFISRKDFDKEMAFERAKFEGAVLSTYEAILFEMTETSKDANFKTISNLVK